MKINEAPLVVRPQDLRPMASKIVSSEIERGTNLKIFKILRAAGKKVSTQKAGEGEADKGTNRRGFKVVIEATIKDIKDILTTIGKSQNMDQAVQMVMKKYKVDQGKAKAMVKKAIDSGVTYDKIKKKYAKESVELEEAPKVPDGMKFLGAYEYKDANGKYHSHRHYSKGGKMNSPVVVYIDEKEWKTFQSFTKARKAAINHIKGMKESVELDEAALKTSDYPKGTSMSAQKFKDSQKKMSKQRALTTKDYPKGTSMSATAWKNKQEEVEVDEASKVPAGMKFIAAYEYKDANGKKHSHRHYSKGGKMTSPVVVHIDGKEWKTFQSFTKAKQAAINHIKGMKESVELDEANAIDLARDVVKNKGAKKGLDMQTANAILTVYNKVNDANKNKMETMPVAKLSSAVWKILGKAK